MSKEGIKFLLASINRQIDKLSKLNGEYCVLTLAELLKLRAYYENQLKESK